MSKIIFGAYQHCYFFFLRLPCKCTAKVTPPEPRTGVPKLLHVALQDQSYRQIAFVEPCFRKPRPLVRIVFLP